MATHVLLIPAEESTNRLYQEVLGRLGWKFKIGPSTTQGPIRVYGFQSELELLDNSLREDSADWPRPVENSTISKQTEPYEYQNGIRIKTANPT